MNTLSKPQAEKIELIAKFMGYTGIDHYDNRNGTLYVYLEDGSFIGLRYYDDENHFRDVLEQIMEDEVLGTKFIWELMGEALPWLATASVKRYCKATLPERCDAVVAVISQKVT